TIREVLVKDGDRVDEGDILCLFDTRAFDVERKVMELDVLCAKNALTALYDWSPQTEEESRSKSRQRAEGIATLELAEARLEYALCRAPPEGGLCAPCSGMIYGLAMKQTDTFYAGDILLSVLPDEKPELKFFLPHKEGENFSSGVLVQALLETVKLDNDGNEVFVRQAVQGRMISGVLYGGQWECRAGLNAFDGFPVAGQEVPLRVSQQGEKQEFVIPLNCLFDKDAYTKVVYVINNRSGLFGEESYLTATAVEMLFNNGIFASLDGDNLYLNMTLAAEPSEPVSDGDVVWVRD
ncbi:MAG: biotin/lipoyl-binding protein, partial [Oscillospiraceae bacterium]|nr:biotin/lipoyl-binding protein [Oscillospiraceae bacterium]